jgi:hypothetical protein
VKIEWPLSPVAAGSHWYVAEICEGQLVCISNHQFGLPGTGHSRLSANAAKPNELSLLDRHENHAPSF